MKIIKGPLLFSRDFHYNPSYGTFVRKFNVLERSDLTPLIGTLTKSLTSRAGVFIIIILRAGILIH